MKKTLLVLRHEIFTVVSRPSFLFGMFGIPLLGALVFFVAGRINQNQGAQSVVQQIVTSPPEQLAGGYVDQAGIIQMLPPGLPEGMLLAYPDEAAARAALDAGEIGDYYIVPPDYIASGEIIQVRPDFNPLSGMSQSDVFGWVLRVNLLEGDAQLAALSNGPLDLQETNISPLPQRDENNILTFFLPYSVTMIFYIVILGAASLLLSSVTKEKESRIMEVLMVSVTPQQLLTGKIIGLGVVGLLQTIVWVGTGQALLAASGSTFNLPETFQLPPSFLAWGLVFFLLGYAVYASLMAGLGALVPNLREASQATIVVILPLIVPLFLINMLIELPHGSISTAMSLFPLTAPVVMMTRLSAGGVPAWQPPLAALLTALTAVLVLRAVAGMFRAQALLSGQPFSVKLFFKALAGKA